MWQWPDKTRTSYPTIEKPSLLADGHTLVLLPMGGASVQSLERSNWVMEHDDRRQPEWCSRSAERKKVLVRGLSPQTDFVAQGRDYAVASKPTRSMCGAKTSRSNE